LGQGQLARARRVCSVVTVAAGAGDDALRVLAGPVRVNEFETAVGRN